MNCIELVSIDFSENNRL